MDNIGGKAALPSLIGFAAWHSLSDSSRRNILQMIDEFAEAIAERPNMPSGSQAIPRVVHPRQIDISPSTQTNPLEFDWAAILGTLKLPSDSSLTKAEEALAKPTPLEPDARWLNVIVPPAVVLIVGKRGSGKSSLAYRLLELFRYHSTPYVVGVPSNARRLLPGWIGIVSSLEELPIKAIAVVDEAYLHFHARNSMADQNRAMSQLLNLSRQRQQTIIFVSQEARQVDRNVASSANVVIFKDPGMLQPEFERPEIRRIALQAQEALASKGKNKKRWSYIYSPDADFVGLLENTLPSFWKPSLSRLFAAESDQAQANYIRSMNSHDRAEKAKEMRDRGASYSVIARALGVSKSTVVNYIRDYPYRPS